MLSATSPFASATSSVMSFTTPATTSDGRARYSTWTMSGVSSARSAASSFEDVSAVPPTSESLTVTSGLSSL